MCFFFHNVSHKSETDKSTENYEISLSFHFTSHLILEENFGYRRVCMNPTKFHISRVFLKATTASKEAAAGKLHMLFHIR